MCRPCMADKMNAMVWLIFFCYFSAAFCGVLTQGVPGQANEVLEPAFAIAGRKISVIAKQNVILPCQVTNLGNYMVVWKRGIAVLSAGSVKVTPDDRMELVNGYDLQIRDVQAQDGGEYVCQLGTLMPKEITHTLEILVPPRIHHASEMMQVKRGASVTLECRASGNPLPTITWSRKNNLLPSGEQSVEGYSVTIEQVTRHQAGIYQCVASNGVGEAVTESIALHVLYPPEIEVERSWVHSGEGFEAQLVCIVHAEPPADVLWYRDTLRLDTTERRSMEVRGSRHTLIIRKVQASDFGNYSCVADNSLGKMRQYLQLSGKPNQVVFRSDPMGRHRDSYNLTWAVNSYTPIEEFKLYYRRLSDGPSGPPVHYGKRPIRRFPSSPFQDNDTLGQLGHGDWSDVVLPAIPSELFTQQMSYVIRGLEPGSQYEARVQARNRFGWNQLSEKFQFSTRGTDKSLADNLDDPDSPAFSDLDIRDLSMTAYNSARQVTLSAAVALVALAALL